MLFRYISKLRYHIRDLIDYLRAFKRKEQIDLKVVKVNNEEYRMAARKLHADVYLTRKFISDNDIVNGVINEKIDPYHHHSQYFLVLNKKTNQPIATARQIEAKRYKGHYSFAMFKHTDLYKRARKLIRKHAPADCVEISGLAKYRGVSKIAPLLLYRTMWRHSLENKHDLWLLAVDVKLFLRLKLLFGSAIQQAGPRIFYLGSDVIPAILKMQTSIRSLERSLEKSSFYQKMLRYRVAQFMLRDIPLEALDKRERLALERILRKFN